MWVPDTEQNGLEQEKDETGIKLDRWMDMLGLALPPHSSPTVTPTQFKIWVKSAGGREGLPTWTLLLSADGAGRAKAWGQQEQQTPCRV